MKKRIYLAVPYSGFEEKAFELSNKIADELIGKGVLVYAPITMAHPITSLGNLGGNWEVWKKLDFEFIDWCEEIVVINFDETAVSNSVGVQDELKYGRETGKVISNYYK